MDERATMPDRVFLENIRGLNIEQKKIFQKVSIEAELNDAEEQFLLFIIGGAGSAKSYLLTLLVEHCI